MSQPSQQSPQEPPKQPPHHFAQHTAPQASQQPPHYPSQYAPHHYPPSSYPPRDYIQPQSTGAPYSNTVPPPLKRPRLSPNPQSPYSSQSPYNSPSPANIALPNQVFSSPYYGAPVNGAPPSNNTYYNSINNTPQASAPPPTMPNQAGSMGPPSRPNDKPTDMNELSDVLLGSGVDLREEEAALMNRRNATQQTATIPPPHDYNHYSSNVPGGAGSFYGGGTFNQPAVPLQTEEERLKAAAELKVRRRAERAQYHLNSPFLSTGPLERCLRKGHMKEQIPYNIRGMGIVEPPSDAQPREIIVVGPDNNEVLTVVKDENLLYQNSSIVDVLALLSLACEEHIRNMVEDVAAAAHNRYISSHNVVPHDLQDIATGEGKPETVPTPSEGDMSITSKPLKRSYASVNNPTSLVLDGVYLPTTIRYSSQMVEAMYASAVADREAHIDMLWNRHKREAAKAAKEASEASSASPSGAGLVAPEVEPTKKGPLKKEQRKQAEAKASEAQQAAATNRTMQLAMGKKGAPSWMLGGAKSVGSSSAFSRPGASLGKNAPKTRADIAATIPPARRLAQLPEKKTIDMRDMIFVLEKHRTAKRVLGRAYMRRNSPGGMARGWWTA